MSPQPPGPARRVLVLNDKPLRDRPLRRWVGPHPTLVLITSQRVAATASRGQLADYDVIETVDDYRAAALERCAIALGSSHRVTHVLSAQEDDVMRAARIRQALSVHGQTPASAAAYRDKLRMRRLAARAGIGQPAFAPVRTQTELRAFAQVHGFPIVVKPRFGSGSQGIDFVHDRTHLETQLEAMPQSPISAGRWLAETYVNAPFFHIDIAEHVRGLTETPLALTSQPHRPATHRQRVPATASPGHRQSRPRCRRDLMGRGHGTVRTGQPQPGPPSGTRGTATGGDHQSTASTQMPGAVPDSRPVVRLDAQSEVRARPRAGHDECAAVPARQRGQPPRHLRTGLCRRAREHQRAPVGQRGHHVGPPLTRVVDEQNPQGIEAALAAHRGRGGDVRLRQADDGAPFLTETGR